MEVQTTAAERRVAALDTALDRLLGEIHEEHTGLQQAWDSSRTTSSEMIQALEMLGTKTQRARNLAVALREAERAVEAAGLAPAERVELDNERGAMAAERAAGA